MYLTGIKPFKDIKQSVFFIFFLNFFIEVI